MREMVVDVFAGGGGASVRANVQLREISVVPEVVA
jgi:hypothetical protein